MSEILDVVNDHDEVIGQAERDEVHKIGLLCRLVYICFYTTDGKIIFQKRSTTKKNDPGRLTTTVSGHVESGQSYLQAAVREALEETGIKIKPEDLKNIGVIRADFDQGDYRSHAMRGLFAYKFEGSIEDLKVEDGDGAGFVSMSVDEFKSELHKHPEKFATVFTYEPGERLITGVQELLST